MAKKEGFIQMFLFRLLWTKAITIDHSKLVQRNQQSGWKILNEESLMETKELPEIRIKNIKVLFT